MSLKDCTIARSQAGNEAVPFSPSFPIVQAATTQQISTSIQLSLCGNAIAEFGEECDNADLATQSCLGLGYEAGTLSCDTSRASSTHPCVAELLLLLILLQHHPTHQARAFHPRLHLS